jgi:hypothetical protein
MSELDTLPSLDGYGRCCEACDIFHEQEETQSEDLGAFMDSFAVTARFPGAPN